jgi:hypothetical protein
MKMKPKHLRSMLKPSVNQLLKRGKTEEKLTYIKPREKSDTVQLKNVKPLCEEKSIFEKCLLKRRRKRGNMQRSTSGVERRS